MMTVVGLPCFVVITRPCARSTRSTSTDTRPPVVGAKELEKAVVNLPD